MHRFRGLARGCHPGPTVVVTGIAVALSLAVGRDRVGVVLVGSTVFTGQLSIGWSNDWIDARRDVLSDREDKPVVSGDVTARALKIAAWWALVLCVPLSFLNGFAAGCAHLGLVGSGWAYNLGLKRTAWSWAPFAVGFGLLPAFVTLGLPGAPWPPWWAMLAASLLAVGAHFANALPDIDDDLAHGVRGLPQRLGWIPAGTIAVGLLVTASLIVLLAPRGTPTHLMWAGAALVVALAAIAVVSVRRRRLSIVFHCAMGIALVNVLLLVESASVLSRVPHR